MTITQIRDKPCDLILYQFFKNKYCLITDKSCGIKLAKYITNYARIDKNFELFKHVGKFSSLAGQIRGKH